MLWKRRVLARAVQERVREEFHGRVEEISCRVLGPIVRSGADVQDFAWLLDGPLGLCARMLYCCIAGYVQSWR